MIPFHLRQVASAVLVLVLTVSASGQELPRSDADLAVWIKQRIQTWQPTAEERRFDDIAWVSDLRTARQLSQKHDRPLFLFTHDGHMDIGRC